jgi:hypothetical protein
LEWTAQYYTLKTIKKKSLQMIFYSALYSKWNTIIFIFNGFEIIQTIDRKPMPMTPMLL